MLRHVEGRSLLVNGKLNCSFRFTITLITVLAANSEASRLIDIDVLIIGLWGRQRHNCTFAVNLNKPALHSGGWWMGLFEGNRRFATAGTA